MTDPLWDPSDGRDPEIERLETVLAPLRHRAPLRPLPARRRVSPIVGAVFALAAAALVAIWLWPSGEGFRFEVVSGSVLVGGAETSSGVLEVGEVLETDRGDRVRVEVADIGTIELEEHSRLGLVETGPNRHRLDLRHGRLRARVVAPPRLFVIDTPAATAVDLGCAYDLEVGPDGSGMLRVTSGAVELVTRGAIAYVPRGASSRIVAGRGPGTPAMNDASVELRAAIDHFDGGDRSAIDRIAALVTANDTLTLWNLLARSDLDRRARTAIVDSLDRVAPSVVDRDRAIAGDRDELERLKERLRHRWLRAG